MNTINRDIYGTKEQNGLVDAVDYHCQRTINHGGLVDWTTKGLKVTRLRLISDPGYPVWDVSYCHGTLNGQDVDVQLPFSQIPKRKVNAFIIEWAKKDGVFAKGLGILDNISTLN
jgi:hypothetical protein